MSHAGIGTGPAYSLLRHKSAYLRMTINLQNARLAAATLVEVVAAVAVLAISVGGLMAAMASGFHTMHMTRENQRATQILMEQAEMIRLYNWNQVTNPGFIPPQFFEVYDPHAPGGNVGCTYTGQVIIAPVSFPATYAPNLRQVTVRVNWSTKGIPRSRELTTLVSRDGLQNYVY